MENAPKLNVDEPKIDDKNTGHNFMRMPDGTVVDITDMTKEEVDDLNEQAREGLK